MRALGMIASTLVMLTAIGMGATGHGDLLMFALCVAGICIVASGQVLLSARGMQFEVRLPSTHSLSSEKTAEIRTALRFLHRALPLGDTRSITFRIRTRNTGRFIYGVVFAIGLASVNHLFKEPRHPIAGLLVAELSAGAVLGSLLTPAFLYYGERHLLNDARMVFTSSYAPVSELSGTTITYSFHDEQGQRCGGSSREFSSEWEQGELALIFYDRRDPDRNRPNFGFQFHEFIWVAPLGELSTAAGR